MLVQEQQKRCELLSLSSCISDAKILRRLSLLAEVSAMWIARSTTSTSVHALQHHLCISVCHVDSQEHHLCICVYSAALVYKPNY